MQPPIKIHSQNKISLNALVKRSFDLLVKTFKLLLKINPAFLTPISIIAASLVISAAIIISAFIISPLPNNQNPNRNSIITQPADGLGGGAGSAAAPQQPAPAANPISLDKLDKVTPEDHLKGDRNARYQLIEYSDLECPYCKKFHPDVQKVLQEYSGSLSWIYRHFPLDSIHSKARKEAEAAECAAEQGGHDAFWKFVDEVFAITPANNGLDAAELPKIANRVGLDGPKLQSCIDSGKMSQKVEAQYQSGIKAGIAGTPASILLDTKTGKTDMFSGAYPYNQLKSRIEAMVNGSQE